MVTMHVMPGPSTKQGDSSPSPLLILASASPRRREIFSDAWSGSLEVCPSGVDEDGPMSGEIPADYAMRLAAAKAQAAAKARKAAARSAGALVIAADTVVELDGLALGKPEGSCDARAMLRSLRGREHSVTTGLAVAAPDDSEILTGFETTIVKMRRYSGDEIDAYVASGGPLDKAGGYGIQDLAFAPAQSVRGCYLNVVGLPLCRLSALLEKAEPGTGSALDLGSCAASHTAAVVNAGAAV